MSFFSKIGNFLPARRAALLAVLSAVLMIFAFPDFGIWSLAWFGLIPLLYAVGTEKGSFVRAFLTGWLYGVVFYFGTCWWLTFAPITYAGFPAALAYLLLFFATSIVALYTGLFAGLLALVLRRFGRRGLLAAPFLWTAVEFLRLWTTGNNWNAVGYSQAFDSFLLPWADVGGVFIVGFLCLVCNVGLLCGFLERKANRYVSAVLFNLPLLVILLSILYGHYDLSADAPAGEPAATVIAVQPNVPMSGLTSTKWRVLRERQAELAERELRRLEPRNDARKPGAVTVILPESPMNYQYEQDPEFRRFINDFATRNRVAVLFNSAEPDRSRERGYFNSALLISERGEKVVQYDKIHLLPFGEMVPLPGPLEWIIPPMVGRFSPGGEYDLIPLGGARAGVMICFESHFPSLSREYVRRGADALVEMTNDGYLGNTPVLRQHLASGVFRAVETNRPVLRVTNVGITAYIDGRGEVHDPPGVYREATRVWTVPASDGRQTVYVRYGEWFAWLCVLVGLVLVALSLRKTDGNGRESEAAGV